MATDMRTDILVRLPIEISEIILSFLDGDDLWRLLKVSKAWRLITNNDFIWKKQCLINDLDINKDLVSGETFELCKHAKIWGEWRWGIIYNWEMERFLQKELNARNLMSHHNIATYGRTIAVCIGSKIFIYTRKKSKIITLNEDTFPGTHAREVQMNKDYLVVVMDTHVVVYRTEDYKPYMLCGFITGQVHIYRDNFSTFNDHLSLQFASLYENKLWLGEHLFIYSASIVDLSTGLNEKFTFPWKCTLMKDKDIVLACANPIYKFYTLSGDELFELESFDFTWMAASKNVVGFITEDQIIMHSRSTGSEIGIINKILIDHNTNYDKDILYGITKTKTPYNKLEAISLLNGVVIWFTELPGDYQPQVRSFLNTFICYDLVVNRIWYLLDAKKGKCLFKRSIPNEGRLIYVSNAFWVCQVPEKLIIRFY